MRSHHALLFSVCAFLAIAGAPRRAVSDVLPPAGDCEGKRPGDACVDEEKKAGACGSISYTRSLPPTTGGPAASYTSTYFGCRTGDAPSKKAGGMCAVMASRASSESGLAVAAIMGLAFGASVARRRRR